MAGHIVPTRVYWIVFAALMVLLVLTVFAAQFDLGGAVNDSIMLLIASSKALLVVLYFMHVRYAVPLTWVFAGAGLIWLIILITFTMSDYLTRGWVL